MPNRERFATRAHDVICLGTVMLKILYFMIFFSLAFSATAAEKRLNEKDALCLGFKWNALRQSGIELFVPRKINEYTADLYVADFTVSGKTVFIINAPINTDNPEKGINIGFLDSGNSGGEIKIYVHYKSANGVEKNIYELPPVSRLMYFDHEQC
jgi:hypothetical protein